MATEIRKAASLSEELKKVFFGGGDNVVGPQGVNLRFQGGDLHLVAYEGGKPVGHLGILKHSVSAGGKRVCVGGLGNLVTVEGGRMRGHARALLEHAQRVLCDEMGVCFGMLFCPPKLVGFCERAGWRVLDEKVFVDQPQGKAAMPLVTMIWPCRRQDWPPGDVDVGRLPW